MLMLLLTLCLLCGAAGAAAEDNLTGTPVQIGKASFMLPEGVVLLFQNDSGLLATSPEYDLWLMWKDWAELPVADLEAYTGGSIQMDHLYAMYLAQTDDAQAAQQVAEAGVETDISQLSGEPVLYVVQDGMVLCSYYNRHTGFLVRAMPANAENTDAAREACRKIALSFRLDGVTDEEMRTGEDFGVVVVTADSAWVRKKASFNGSIHHKALKGDTYELIGTQKDWYIVDVNGQKGYIHSGVCEIQK